MASPLIERLTAEFGVPVVDGDGAQAFLTASGPGILFLTGDPATNRETNDVAVVLPELLSAMGPSVRAAVADRAAEAGLMARFGVLALPALVVVRDGAYAGSIAKMQDWGVYVSRLHALLTGATQALPADAPAEAQGAS